MSAKKILGYLNQPNSGHTLQPNWDSCGSRETSSDQTSIIFYDFARFFVLSCELGHWPARPPAGFLAAHSKRARIRLRKWQGPTRGANGNVSLNPSCHHKPLKVKACR